MTISLRKEKKLYLAKRLANYSLTSTISPEMGETMLLVTSARIIEREREAKGAEKSIFRREVKAKGI
jgi:hypothetical protein